MAREGEKEEGEGGRKEKGKEGRRKIIWEGRKRVVLASAQEGESEERNESQ